MTDVYISKSETSRNFYHTDADCYNLPDDDRTRTVALDKLNSAYQHCDICADNADYGKMRTLKCPEGCGETMKANKLRFHLPCDGEPEVPADD